ncbi:transporter substrate-binding domain-containing protein [Bifidobacterium pullorum]|uniref:transporter substrate-binding domain-containing protein n=1 Tax=Bifidobacterium pullorum TaxID=78448 RepID=UPI001EF55C12|nr:transporter substrate-binding domain-containing protein [Bifidobacterium pullorum]
METQDPPYSYAGEDGTPKGFDVDVLKALDRELGGYRFEYSSVDYQTALAGTKQGRYDALIGAFFATPARAKQYLLSKPYDYYFMNLVVPEESPIDSLQDLDGKTLDPIVPTDGRYTAIQAWLKRHPDISITVPTVTSQETFPDMFRAVHDGTYDAVYLSKAQYDGVADSLGFPMKVTAPVDAAGTVILYDNSQRDLRHAVDGAIDRLVDDGTLPKLNQRYFHQDDFALARQLGVAPRES